MWFSNVEARVGSRLYERIKLSLLEKVKLCVFSFGHVRHMLDRVGPDQAYVN